MGHSTKHWFIASLSTSLVFLRCASSRKSPRFAVILPFALSNKKLEDRKQLQVNQSSLLPWPNKSSVGNVSHLYCVWSLIPRLWSGNETWHGRVGTCHVAQSLQTQVAGQLELNLNNSCEVLSRAAQVRRRRFLRMFYKQITSMWQEGCHHYKPSYPSSTAYFCHYIISYRHIEHVRSH